MVTNKIKCLFVSLTFVCFSNSPSFPKGLAVALEFQAKDSYMSPPIARTFITHRIKVFCHFCFVGVEIYGVLFLGGGFG